LVDDTLRNLCKRIKKQAEYLGAFLGKKEKPSLFLLQLLAKNANKKVWLNEKGAWLFICGRDVFAKSIVKAENADDFVLIMNEYDECLGFGQVVDLSAKKVAIKRMFDIGDFLRRER
jgi:ribosome biogenesis protein Nip4